MPPALGLDSSVLSPFARAQRLPILEMLTQDRRRVVTPAVLAELDRGCAIYPALAEVRSLAWLERVAADSLDELIVFNEYVRILGSSSRNIGESSILAWAERAAGVVLIDDGAAVQAAKARNVMVRRSLALIADGLNRRRLDATAARTLIDDLIGAGGARYPCTGADFEAWAEENGLLAR